LLTFGAESSASLSVKNPQQKFQRKGNYSTINTNKYKISAVITNKSHSHYV